MSDQGPALDPKRTALLVLSTLIEAADRDYRL